MALRSETVERVRAYWRRWEKQDAPHGVSIVVIGDERFVSAPDRLRPRVQAEAPGDLRALVELLGEEVEVAVGEARLAYADDSTLRLVATEGLITLTDDDAELAAFAAASDSAEWRESSADEPSDYRVGVVEAGSLVAVATLRIWDGALGHVSVFSAASARRRGLASRTGSAVVDRAMALGVVPQWRSRLGNDASAHTADNLGFVALGRQMFVRLNH